MAAQVSALRAAKQQLRKGIRQALASMTDQQRKEESDILVRKVRDSLRTCYIYLCIY